MWLLIAEAFIALGMFVFIVWWTMSTRRRNDSTAAKPVIPAGAAPTDLAEGAAADPSARDKG